LDHAIDLIINSGKVPVEHDFLVTLTFESVYLRQVYITRFLTPYLIHVKIGLAKILGGPKIFKT